MKIESKKYPHASCTQKLDAIIIPLVKQILSEEDKKKAVGCLLSSFDTNTHLAHIFAIIGEGSSQKTGYVEVFVPGDYNILLIKGLTEHKGKVFISEKWFLEDEVPSEFNV